MVLSRLSIPSTFKPVIGLFLCIPVNIGLVQAETGSTQTTEIRYSAPPIALAKTYQPSINITDYWVSEKLDGVRAYWNGEVLLSKTGQIYNAPLWFISDFPDQALDGELWSERGQFESLLSTVRKMKPVDEEWRLVKFMVFDLPESETRFDKRLQALQFLIQTVNSPYLQLIEHFKVKNHQALMNVLHRIDNAGGEGLMLHKADSRYRIGRSTDFLKVKILNDAEATVVDHLPGKGKYRNMLGALVVETRQGKRFRIGSGFTDEQRRNPPPVGSIVTYQYNGLTRNGKPRFARFLRVRPCLTASIAC